jgi:hypothetical protein
MLLWQVYLCGALVAAAGASVAADLFSEPDVLSMTRTGVIVFSGALWPVLLVGLLQFTCIGAGSAALAGRRVRPLEPLRPRIRGC